MKLAERKLKENNADFRKILEEYDVLHDKMEKMIDMYQRKDTMIKTDNKKLRAKVKKLQVCLMVLLLAMLVMLYYVKYLFNGAKKMLPNF